MYAVEFRAKIADGKIDIPNQYLQEISPDVKIIMLYENSVVESEKTVAIKKSAKGIISQYANPELIPLEKEAWGEAVREKHAIN